MTGLNHAATGALVAVVVKEPATALPIALLSHFVSDALPHWKLKVKRLFLLADSVLSLVLLAVVSVVFTAPAWLVFSCGLLAILPDAMWLRQVVITGKYKTKNYQSPLLNIIRYLHLKVQWCEPENGWYLEILWFIVTILLVVHFGKTR